MALNLAAKIAAPLSKLFGSKFAAPNFQFPIGHNGPSITFTPQLNPNNSYVKNKPISGSLTFGLGNIRFYLPQQIEMQYTANYQETEMSNMLKAYQSDNFADGLKEFAVRAGAAGAENAGTAIESFTGLSGLRASVYKRTGTAYNNHMEVMFQGVGFREFNFSFKFFPRNAGESAGVIGAINKLKYHMHPNFKAGTGQAIFDVPSVFSINISGDKGFYGGFCEAVLTGMNVNGSGSGVAAQFEDGSPAEIDLTLNFKETSYLTKERLDGAMPF